MTPIGWVYIAGQLVYMGLEYWLGKTDKVKPGSVLETLFMIGGKIFRKKV